MAAKVICIIQQKGGVGKTTTACTVAHALARAGRSTLLIDLDPQGQLAPLLGLQRSSGASHLITTNPNSPADSSKLLRLPISANREKLWIITGNERTAEAQVAINDPHNPKPVSHIWSVLRTLVRTELDYIIMDTSPSVGGIQERAAWAADCLVIPVATEYASLNALENTNNLIKTLIYKHAWRGTVLGYLPTFYDDTTRESERAWQDLNKLYPGLVLPRIHRATIMRECWQAQKTIYELAPKCRPALEYEAVTKDMMRKI